MIDSWNLVYQVLAVIITISATTVALRSAKSMENNAVHVKSTEDCVKQGMDKFGATYPNCEVETINDTKDHEYYWQTYCSPREWNRELILFSPNKLQSFITVVCTAEYPIEVIAQSYDGVNIEHTRIPGSDSNSGYKGRSGKDRFGIKMQFQVLETKFKGFVVRKIGDPQVRVTVVEIRDCASVAAHDIERIESANDRNVPVPCPDLCLSRIGNRTQEEEGKERLDITSANTKLGWVFQETLLFKGSLADNTAARVLNTTRKSAPLNAQTLDITTLKNHHQFYSCIAPHDFIASYAAPFVITPSPKVFLGILTAQRLHKLDSDSIYYMFNSTNVSVTCMSKKKVELYGRDRGNYPELFRIMGSSLSGTNDEYEAIRELRLTDQNIRITCSVVNEDADVKSGSIESEINGQVFQKDKKHQFYISRTGEDIYCRQELRRIRCKSVEECREFPYSYIKKQPQITVEELRKQILSDYTGNWVQCGNAQTTMVRGLDSILYDDIDDVPLDAKLRIIRPKGLAYVDGSYQFSCQSHDFAFSGPHLWFAKSGQTSNDTESGRMDDSKLVQTRSLGNGVTQSDYTLKLRKGLDKVFCRAPSRRTKEWLTVGFILEEILKDPVAPVVDGPAEQTVDLSPGDESTLYCTVTASSPQAQISFEYYQDENDTWVLLETPDSSSTKDKGFVTVTTSVNEISVAFRPFQIEHVGDYRCNATNGIDTTQKLFHVQIKAFMLTPAAYVGIVLGIVVIIVAVAAFQARHRFEQLKSKLYLTEEEIREFREGAPSNSNGTSSSGSPPEPMSLPFNQELEIPQTSINVDKTNVIGSGEFGMVYRGSIEGIEGYVAIKTAKRGKSAQYFRSLLSEIKVMSFIGRHPNIVKFIGAYTQEIENGVVYIIMEYCALKSMDNYLLTMLKPQDDNKQHLNVRRMKQEANSNYANLPNLIESNLQAISPLLMWISQTADAMSFIASKNVVHADLATRNVLLTSDLTAKLTDFGLSRKIYQYNQYVTRKQEPLPWRWMSPESLQYLKFSIKSDVWTFGIFMWEVMEFGGVPYPGLNWDVQFAERLLNGLRPPQPKFASKEWYNIMLSCWEVDAAKRPTMSNVKDAIDFYLQKFYTKMKGSAVTTPENVRHVSPTPTPRK